MEDREFMIPQDRDDLQIYHETQYSVKDVSTVDLIRDQYTGCRIEFETDGSSFIYEKFDFMYSCLVHFQNIPWTVIHELWDVSLEGLRSIVKTLGPLLNTKEDLEDQMRAQVLRNTKMMFYIFSELLVRCEERQLQDKACAMPQKGRRKVVESDDTWNWSNQKSLALTELYRLVKLPLNKLWKPANISEDFLDQMSRACLKLLEDREIGFVNKKAMRDSIFQILSILCKEYIFGLALMPRIIQMLMLYEHLAAPLAQSVAQLESQDGNVGMLRLALQELNSDMDFLNKSGHNCGQFILELGKAKPEGIIKHMALVTEHLGRDPYSMRMGVLELMGYLLLKMYNSPTLNEEQIANRDLLFEYLIDHLYDVTAFCRCKVLQVWKDLCVEEVVPTSVLLTVVEKVQPIIIDKSSTTRKDAIKFMKSVLEHNPFAARLDVEELRNQLVKAKGHLLKMEQKAGISEEDDPEFFWGKYSEDIAQIIYQLITEETPKDTPPDKEDQENESQEQSGASMAKHLLVITKLLKDKKFEDAVKAGMELINKYDTKNVLGVAKKQMTQGNQQASSDSSSEDDSDFENEDGGSRISSEQKKQQRKVQVVIRLMHMACLAQAVDNQDKPLVTDKMQEEMTKQKELIQFLQDSLKFSEMVHSAVERVLQVLEVSQTTELSEAIDFIATAQQFGLLPEEQGMTRLLSFVHSKDANLKTSITSAYKRIYLQAMNPEAVAEVTHENVIEAMQKLCQLIQQSPDVYEGSLRELIQSWVASKDINKECIDVLWDMVTGTKKEECVAAMNLLHMVLDGNPENVREHIPYLEKFGLGKRGEDCFELARNACKVLTLASPKIASDQENDPYKLHKSNEIFHCLSKVIIGGLHKNQDKFYNDMVHQAMIAIFKVCEEPGYVVSSILQGLINEIVEGQPDEDNDKTLTPKRMSAVTSQLTSVATQLTQHTLESQTQTGKQGTQVSQIALARFMETLCSVAHQLLIFLMEEVLIEMRRQRNCVDKNLNNRTRDEEIDSDASISSVNSQIVKLGSLTEEEALDKVQHTCNHEVLDKDSLLGLFLPLIETICKHPTVYTHPALQVAAVQAMGRCMMLSQTFCAEKLRLFCTIMVKSQDFRVRVAAIHCMADLLRRFPNEADPYSPSLYECLKDADTEVRREGLVVLSKLILGDMVRVKFQISYLAACLTDTDPCCRDIASFFFATLATKGNILYNLVLDMISQLSSEGSDKNQKDFETIMRVILPYIDKERQVVSLVEKLCARFPEKTTEEECHNLALCINILPPSLKSVKALRDSFTFYADKLKFVTVKMTFDAILQNAKKHLKGENKDFLEDFQENLDKCCDKQAVMEAAAQMAAAASKEKAAEKAAAPKGGRKGGRRRKQSSEEDEDSGDTVKSSSTATSRRSTRVRKPSRKIQDSLDSDDAFQAETPAKSRASKTPAARKQTAPRTQKRANPPPTPSESEPEPTPRRTGRSRTNLRL